MRRLRESIPRLLLGRAWSDRFPWRFHLSLDRFAARGLYRRQASPDFRLRAGAGDACLLFAGDLALHRWSLSESPGRVFQGVIPEFEAADFRVVNLESVLTDRDKAAGKIGSFLKGPLGGVEVLEYLKIDAATSANNHALDYGSPGLADTGRALGQSGIGWFGVDEGHAPDGIPGALIRTVNGVTVGMIAATDHFGGCPHAAFPAPVWASQGVLEAGVQALRSRCDIAVVQLHWGYEYVMYPLRWHRDQARALVDLGADIVCCHHAHVVMGVEVWGRGVIAHGLGNFYFGPENRKHPFRAFGTLLSVSVDRSGPISARVSTVRTDSSNQVLMEREACPGYERLCVGLADDPFLERVEAARVSHELAQLASGIQGLLNRREMDLLLERQVFLKAPRQEWLLNRAEESTDSRWRSLGSWLRTFRSLSEEAVLRLDIAPSPGIRGLHRRLDTRLLPGRLP